MDTELKRRVEALRRPLELAAADGFAGVRRVQGLGHALRNACDGLYAKLPSEALAAWRVVLGGWEKLDEAAQAVEVARGMRLIARMPRPSGAAAAAIEVRREEAAGKVKVAKGVELSAKEPKAAKAPGPFGPVAREPRTSTRPPAPEPRAAVEPPPAKAPKARAAVEPSPAKAPKARAAVEPPVPEDPLAAPTHSLPGIGPAFADRLAERSLVTVEDLLWCLPRRYDDVRDARPLAEIVQALDDGQRATFSAEVKVSRMIFGRGRRWAEVWLHAGPSAVCVRWFNVYAGIEKRMPPGARVVLSGVVRRRGGRPELANPDILAIQLPDDEPAARALPSIIARYPDVPGVPASRLRAACAAACARVGTAVDDGVPPLVEDAAQMPRLADALAQLHAPPAATPAAELAAMNAGASRWQRRLAFGELFALGVAVARRRRERRADAAVPCAPAPGLDAELARALPFALTRAQRRTIDELGTDLSRDTPMNRLLQGDVGAGKTAVAFAAALQVARAGRQTAVMAPTELLAEQHAETWRRWAAASGLAIDLLTAATPRGVRASLLSLLAAGKLDVLIGTHALLSEGVGFGALGLVVIDEQHRFGVAQRARLRDKGDGQGAPHLLVMTATPIPRTLALTAYGDLDVSLLDELPPGRTPVKTKILTGARGCAAAYKLIAERARAGERAYVVCPKIAATDDAPAGRAWKDATAVAGDLARALPGTRVGLIHGQLDGDERDRTMRAFKTGALDVLVATTVIEVGVDVPAATVMVIHDAERFGLAQLHQLRGRVGRGTGAAQCVLLAQGSLGADAETRLAAMVATTDGFQIAEQDLALRGPGELLGPRQAGVPRLRFGDLAQHTELLLEARRHAEQLLERDPELADPAHAALRRALDRRFARDVYGAEGG